MKTCTHCKLEKSLNEFPWRKQSENERQAYCKECKKEYNKRWYDKHKEEHKQRVSGRNKRVAEEFYELINRLKSVPCKDCKQSFPSCAMDFDHIDENKFKNVAQMTHHAMHKVVAEIAKCEVVCAVCHRIRTASRRSSEDRALVS